MTPDEILPIASNGVGVRIPPLAVVPNQAEAPRFGWRLNRSCYAVNVVPAGCPSSTWFYVLLGVAVVAGLSTRKGNA